MAHMVFGNGVLHAAMDLKLSTLLRVYLGERLWFRLV